MTRDQIITKLRKLLALANQGVGGEKENAQRQLDKWLAKYGIPREEIESEQRKRIWLTYKDAEERRIAVQVIAWAMDKYDAPLWKRGAQKRIGVDVTNAERLQIFVAYGIYCREYAKLRNDLLVAFFGRNELFPPSAKSEHSQDIEEERLRRLQGLMSGIDKTHIHRRLEKA